MWIEISCIIQSVPFDHPCKFQDLFLELTHYGILISAFQVRVRELTSKSVGINLISNIIVTKTVYCSEAVPKGPSRTALS